MNSNLLNMTDYFAYYRSRPKGRTPVGAAKVKVLSIHKTSPDWGQNKRTSVTILIVEQGTYAYAEENERTLTVPARDILDYWDSYKDRESILVEERQQQEWEYKRGVTRTQVIRNLLEQRLEERGLPLGTIKVGGDTVIIPLSKMCEWLGVEEDEIDRLVDHAICPSPKTHASCFSRLPYS